MKTAMQELIEELKTISTQISKEGNIDMVAALSYAIDAARESIEKEKKQIIATYNVAKAEAKMFTELHTTGTKYYNETYNQNK